MRTFCAPADFSSCRGVPAQAGWKRRNPLLTDTSRRRPAVTPRPALSQRRGSFDLSSIMIAGGVVGFLAAVVMVAIFAVIPFSQDKSAEQNLSAVVVAQQAVKGSGNPYLPMTGLVTSDYLQDHDSIGVYTSDDNSCFVAVSKSKTGAMYYVTSERNEPRVLTRETITGCMPQQWIETILGPAKATEPATAEPAPTPSEPTPTPSPTAEPARSAEPSAIPGETTPAPEPTATKTAPPATETPAVTEPAPPPPASAPTATCPGDERGLDRGPYGDCSTVVPVPGRSVTSISATTNATCAVADGRGYCWGTGKSDVPREINMSGALAGKTITSISVSPDRTCVTASGDAYCWGSAKKDVPVKSQLSGPISGKDITSISTAPSRTCAVAGGTPYCWGSGSNETPMPVTSGPLGTKPVESISASNSTTCATAAGGAAYCWEPSSAPIQVGTAGGPAGNPVTSISAAENITCLTAGGKAYCWSDDAARPQEFNASGALTGKNTTSISAAPNRTCAIAERTAYCWGPGNWSWEWLFGAP